MENFKHFVISKNHLKFVISQNRFCGITKSILMSQNALVVLYVMFACVFVRFLSYGVLSQD